MAIDPVCQMQVDEATALSAEKNGETFYFCCESCRVKFLDPKFQSAPPELFSLSPVTGTANEKPTSSSARYFCPMCEGVESDVPAACPKCGMALEAVSPVLPQTKTIYTCPMHPEIEQDSPGACPKCGMDLEPKTIEADGEEDDSELRSMTVRFWVSTALGVPVLLLAMLGDPLLNFLSLSRLDSLWIQLVLSTPVVLWAGWPFFQRAWQSLLHRSLNMF